jgi:hypothetical protein
MRRKKATTNEWMNGANNMTITDEITDFLKHRFELVGQAWERCFIQMAKIFLRMDEWSK